MKTKKTELVALYCENEFVGIDTIANVEQNHADDTYFFKRAADITIMDRLAICEYMRKSSICDDEDYNAFLDGCIKINSQSITTLDELCDYLNFCADWPTDVDEIIERNHWSADVDDTWQVCKNETEKIVEDDFGTWFVSEL